MRSALYTTQVLIPRDPTRTTPEVSIGSDAPFRNMPFRLRTATLPLGSDRRATAIYPRSTRRGGCSGGSGNALDEQPEREPHLEHQQGQPYEPGERAADQPGELQRKDDCGQGRPKHADPGQHDGDHPAAEEKPGEKRAAHGEEGCPWVPRAHPEKERAERVRCSGVGCIGSV